MGDPKGSKTVKKRIAGKKAPRTDASGEGTAVPAAAAPVAEAVAEAATEGFGKKKNISFDMFAVAPQAKKESRREVAEREKKERADKAATEGTKVLTAHQRLNKRHLSHAVDEHAEEDRRTVFVGNLPNTIGRKEVARFFGACGEVESARVRCQVLERSADGKQRGRAIQVLRKDFAKDESHSATAYVLFKHVASVHKACEMTGMVLNNRHLTVTEESPTSKAYDPKTSVFLGNLGYDTADEHVWQFFIENGVSDTRRVRIIRDRDTGKCKGFGYAEFASPATANLVIPLRGKELNGREVRMCHVQKSKDPRAAKLQSTRRDARKEQNQRAKKAGPLKREQTAATQRQVPKDANASWMGMATNPRKKLDRDLRPLIPNNQVLSKEKRVLKARGMLQQRVAKHGWDDGN